MSVLQDQIAADFLTFDGLETGTYKSRADENGNFSTGETLQMLGTRGQTETESDVGQVGAGRRMQVWHLRARDLSEDAKVRDRIVDSDGVTWEVVFVQLQSLSQRWRLTCIETETQDGTAASESAWADSWGESWGDSWGAVA